MLGLGLVALLVRVLAACYGVPSLVCLPFVPFGRAFGMCARCRVWPGCLCDADSFVSLGVVLVRFALPFGGCVVGDGRGGGCVSPVSVWVCFLAMVS